MNKSKPIRVFDFVNKPYERVHSLLEWNAQTVFRNATKAAALRAEKVASALHVNIGGIGIGKDIEISIKGTERTPRTDTAPESTKIRIEWKASKAPGLFPLMTAEITVFPLTPYETQLDLVGEYEPPLGALGGIIDAAIGHRIAEATVHQFVSDLAAYLTSAIE
jgi:hypothetical protein